MAHNVLIIRLSALGDIAMTVPIVCSACRQHPDVSFTLLTSKMGEKIYRAVAADIANLTVRGVNIKRDYDGLRGLNRLGSELCREHYDTVIDLHDVLRTKWLRLRLRLRGARCAVIDKGRTEKKALIRHAITRPLTPSTERYRATFALARLPIDLCYDPRSVARRLASGLQPIDTPAIGIAPFAQHRGKIYPEDQMLQVIRLLLKAEPRLHIYLFGGPDEQTALDAWTSLDDARIHNVAGRQTIADDIALMARLQCVVSMDSANMHLASLVGTRVVSIWGATHPHAGFLGFGQQEDDVVSLPLSCRPCSIYGNKPCRHADYRCLTGIDPQAIADAVMCQLRH